ncbi:MAG: cyclodeaminase/cyclohydrolase family protein [Candidatus Sericytochromatia bacterium]|nr:cyclodeaminase/cyclohydrolase family protein [Candidatus Sericytochromatia bacterium]
MTDSFTDLPLPELLGRFAAKTPVPGGGSAAAIAGALAATLGEMVGALTLGKKGYEHTVIEVETLRAEARALSRRLLAAAEEDARAYEAVVAAIALPKETDEQKAARKEAMQKAFQGATEPPLGVARSCLVAGRLGLRMLTIGNRNASSDAAVAVLLALAGAEGALLNVGINLSSIQDATFVETTRQEADTLWASIAAMRRDMWQAARQAGLPSPAEEAHA